MKLIRFGQDDIANVVARLSTEEVDGLTFGAIQLDARGNIITFNAAEGKLTGKNPSEMIGRNFFTDVAPCTDTPEFAGVFREGVKRGRLNALFEYVFDHEMVPTRVSVHMKNSLSGTTFWVFVKRV